MTGRKRSKRICAILLSLILFFGSVSEYMFPLYADAVGEDADDDISKDDYNEADEEKPSGESDEDDEAAVSAEDEPEDPSVSDNESVGGGEDPLCLYKMHGRFLKHSRTGRGRRPRRSAGPPPCRQAAPRSANNRPRPRGRSRAARLRAPRARS